MVIINEYTLISLSGFLRNADVARLQADSCLLNAVSIKGDRLSIFSSQKIADSLPGMLGPSNTWWALYTKILQ